MTITQWQYAVAVDKFRHFGKAAKHCNISQPTLSMQLQKLEEELGVILFDRSKNPILPTSEGEVLLDHARKILREYERIPDLLDEFKGPLSGKLKIGVIPTLSPYLVPLFLKNFIKKYPQIKLTIEEYKTEEIIKLLEADELDAALLATPLKNDQIIERVLFYEPFYLYIGEEHSLSTKKKVRESDIKSEDLWLLNEGHCFRQQILKFCSLDAKDSARPSFGEGLYFTSGNLETLKNMVDRVGGVTLLPQLAVNLLTTHDKNKIKPFNDPVPTREISLIHSRAFLKEKSITALQEVILESLPKDLRSPKGQVLEIQ